MQCHVVIEADTWAEAHQKAVWRDAFGLPEACFAVPEPMITWTEAQILENYKRTSFHDQWTAPSEA